MSQISASSDSNSIIMVENLKTEIVWDDELGISYEQSSNRILHDTCRLIF